MLRQTTGPLPPPPPMWRDSWSTCPAISPSVLHNNTVPKAGNEVFDRCGQCVCSDDRDRDVFVYLSLFLTLGTPALSTQLYNPKLKVYKKITILCPDWGCPEDVSMDRSANSTIFSDHSDWKTESYDHLNGCRKTCNKFNTHSWYKGSL